MHNNLDHYTQMCILFLPFLIWKNLICEETPDMLSENVMFLWKDISSTNVQ